MQLFLTLRWPPWALENPKEVSLSYKSTNRSKHSTNKDTNRLAHVSKLQVTNAGLIVIHQESMFALQKLYYCVTVCVSKII